MTDNKTTDEILAEELSEELSEEALAELSNNKGDED